MYDFLRTDNLIWPDFMRDLSCGKCGQTQTKDLQKEGFMRGIEMLPLEALRESEKMHEKARNKPNCFCVRIETDSFAEGLFLAGKDEIRKEYNKNKDYNVVKSMRLNTRTMKYELPTKSQ